VDHIALAAAIGMCLLFGSGVLAGVVLMVWAVIRHGHPAAPPGPGHEGPDTRLW
jgi:hypothetical protein